MAQRDKMYRVVTRVLAVMLVASFLLSVVSFVWPAPVSAQHCHCACRHWMWVVYPTSKTCTLWEIKCCNVNQGCWWTGNGC